MHWSVCVVIFVSLTSAQVVMPPGSTPNMEETDSCSQFRNLSVMGLSKHQYMVAEHCLYYSIQRRVDAEANQPNAIAMLPPHDADKQENTTVHLHGMTLQSMFMSDGMKEARFRGFISVSWMDKRLSWNTDEWKMTTMNVQTSSHIWVPHLSSEKLDSALSSPENVDYKRLKLSNTGNVSAMMVINLQAFCDADLHNYPLDIHVCCCRVQPTFADGSLDFKISQHLTSTVDERYLKNTGFNVNSFSTTLFQTEDVDSGLEFCLKASRSNTTLQMELAIPMAICAILILVSVFFGDLKSQLHVKLFALLLQYLCLQFISNRLTMLGNGPTPRIFRFYEYTIVINLASLLLTLFVCCASRIERSLPPAQSFLNVSTFINKFCCCLSAVDDEDAKVDEKKYAKDWKSIFSAVHSLLMALIVIIYLIGVCVIFS